MKEYSPIEKFDREFYIKPGVKPVEIAALVNPYATLRLNTPTVTNEIMEQSPLQLPKHIEVYNQHPDYPFIITTGSSEPLVFPNQADFQTVISILKTRETLSTEDLDAAINAWDWKSTAAKRDNYQITEAIEQGAYGFAYKAKNKITNKDCCIKMLHIEKSQDLNERQMFLREAFLQCTLDHKNLVKGQDVFVVNNEVLFVMDYAQGQTLRDYKPTCTLDEAKHVLKDLTDVSTYLQSKGIVHKDFTPQNIIVNADPKNLNKTMGAVVLDLGISNIVRPDGQYGTPAYVCVTDMKNDQSIDTFSFGTLLYYLMTKDDLFNRSTVAETHITVIERKSFNSKLLKLIPDLKSQGYASPSHIINFIDKATYPDQFKRFQSSADFYQQFCAAIEASRHATDEIKTVVA